MNQLDPTAYDHYDISDEAWREVEINGRVLRIEAPIQLITRRGGKTHRVVDAAGVVHCYVAPETGLSIVRWQAKPGKPPVRF